MIRLQTILLTSMLVFCSAARLPAEQPTEDDAARQLTMDFIDLFEQHLVELRHSTDNAFVYQQRHETLSQLVNSFKDSQITFSLMVNRITESEVFVEAPYLGGARIVLMFEDDAGKAYFGGSGYRPYHTAPSTRLFNILAPRTSLQIGKDIAPDLAQSLRRRDQLLMDAEVAEIRFRAVSGITPDVVVVVHNFRVNRQPVDHH